MRGKPNPERSPHHAAAQPTPSQEKPSFVGEALPRLRELVRDVALRRREGENSKAALHRAARTLGLTDRVARALFYAEDGFSVAADPGRIARAEAGYRRFLAEEEARIAADLTAVRERLLRVEEGARPAL